MRDDASYGLDDPQHPDDGAALRRVRPAAIFLLIVNVLNLLAGVYFMVNGIIVKKGGGDVEAQTEKMWDDMKADERDAMKKIGISSPSDFVTLVGNICLGWGGLTALVSVLSVFGAARMLSLRSYGLAMFGAIVTAIPCVTPCCLIGQVAGIWAFVILVQPDVRRAFH
jgi:hypothetical protein